MRRLTGAQLEFLHPAASVEGRRRGRRVLTAEGRARGERRRRIEVLGEEAEREASIDHFDGAVPDSRLSKVTRPSQGSHATPSRRQAESGQG